MGPNIMTKRALITGSSGLVGSEAVKFLCKKNWKVFGIDNNIRAYLFGEDASTEPERIKLDISLKNFFHIPVDIRDNEAINKVFASYGPFDFIIHAASQPAHEWSTNNAIEDFQINALGTMNVLEAYRQKSPRAVFIHCSSSKVYGDHVNRLPLKEYSSRFDLPKNHPLFAGTTEDMHLDKSMHSLFGASKACGDIMAQEYGRYFHLPIALFRPVCITGPAHKGAKLHGYLAYLVKCIADGTEYTINGYKGKQVRGNIHSYDLVTAFWEVFKNPKHSYGTAYNIDGGRLSNNSMLEAIAQAEKILGTKGNIKYSDVNRQGDHMWCIFSNAKFQKNYPKWKITYDNDRIMEELCAVHQINIKQDDGIKVQKRRGRPRKVDVSNL